eukprot:scaffold8457_cov112-Isochrysis_galbana.AAC.1
MASISCTTCRTTAMSSGATARDRGNGDDGPYDRDGVPIRQLNRACGASSPCGACAHGAQAPGIVPLRRPHLAMVACTRPLVRQRG